jgi:gamma-glutamylcyclotransferase (GGCT)/AIG2-like uncharacterized protein YtfP
LSLSNRIWYFAYGSNLNVDQMRDRVGEWHLSKRALARNYRLVFNHYSKKRQGYTANLLETGKFEEVVYGAVYHITEEQLKKLQAHEGIAPVEVRVELEDGNERSRAKTFAWKTSDSEREPPKPYRKAIEEGLVQHGYDRSHVEAVFGRFNK